MVARGRIKGLTKEEKDKAAKAVKKKEKKTSSKRKAGYYFYEEEEQALVEYLSTNDEEEKKRIFQDKLYAPFCKMIQSIIRRYKLYVPDEGFDNLFHDTFSHLMEKLTNFDPNSGYKGYSYCGTVCKNYLILRINTFVKEQKKNASYEDNALTLEDSINLSYNNIENQEDDSVELLRETTESIKKEIEDNEEHEVSLTDSDMKVGKALLKLMDNWEDMVDVMANNKFNKTTILYYLKETTLLPTSEINSGLKKFKEIYIKTKNNYFEL